MHSVATMARSKGTEMLMEAQAQNIRRVEADPTERRVLVHLLAGLREAEAEVARLAQQVRRHAAMAEWLMEFNDAEDRDHDGTSMSLRQACEILEGIDAVGLKTKRPLNVRSI